MVQLNRLLARHGFPLLAVGFLVLAAFGGALFVRPFQLDNVLALSLSHRSDPFGFFTSGVRWGDEDIGATLRDGLPEYRPLAYATVWAQEEIGGVRGVQYFLLNLLVWAACCGAVYGVVYVATRSRLAGALAAGALAIDSRALQAAVWILERQSTLACLFGLIAVLLVLRPRGLGRRALGISIGALVLGSA